MLSSTANTYLFTCSVVQINSIKSEDAHCALWVSLFEIAFSSVLTTNGTFFETNKTIKCLNSQFQIRSLPSNYQFYYYCFYLCAFIVRILHFIYTLFFSIFLFLILFFNTRLSTLVMAAAGTMVRRTECKWSRRRQHKKKSCIDFFCCSFRRWLVKDRLEFQMK